MKKYTIGDVSKLLHIKAHVIRYWEQELELLSARKTLSGRRIYTTRDMEILFRFRYLLYEKRYTIEGAKKRIWEEINSSNPDLKSLISAIRSDLIEALSYIRKEL